MVSKSYSNLLDLNSGDSTTFSCGGKKFSRVATIAGVLSELDDENRSTIGSDVPSSISQERMIIVGIQHPLPTHRRLDLEMGWDFSWDEDSLLLQLKDGLGEDAEVMYEGCLKEEIEPVEQDNVAQTLLETFKCVPAFIPPKLFIEFYHGFYKQH
ncbi:alpha,alpha-trehalose-phosphate synthase [udp-forming] 5 [Olea europaea subsp. europaea]|uniref:Alpha,alpha-trehalose-phosphate synthase [udp-forming] 5 n=1 Tax=Olea europaea subsp. europaea TaxID=158383 RepID=A0A8S0PIJ0_OLEEU|nr:alpha,alpha-trehalose-phosphate synthase [udp-forming] 5 [Olea europaea subsp. europaea]